MEYAVGLLLGLALSALATFAGFERERSFYATTLIVIGSYYVLFAVMGAPAHALVMELIMALGFLLLSVFGSRHNLWLVIAGTAAHGVFDAVHHLIIDNPGVPVWWPGFCGTIDLALAACFALRLRKIRVRDLAPAYLPVAPK